MKNKDMITQPTDAEGQYNWGVRFFYGRGVPKGYEQAIKWFTKAAEQGHSYAQGSLGVMYENGRGVTQDYDQAVKWFKKAAEQGNSYAQSHLDDMNSRGK